MYKNLDQSGFQSGEELGEEFATAMRETQAINADIILGDESVDITLRRLTQALSETDLEKLLSPDAEFEETMNDLLPSAPPPTSPASNKSEDEAKFKEDLSESIERLKSPSSMATNIATKESSFHSTI